jgi:hypothetical protein
LSTPTRMKPNMAFAIKETGEVSPVHVGNSTVEIRARSRCRVGGWVLGCPGRGALMPVARSRAE